MTASHDVAHHGVRAVIEHLEGHGVPFALIEHRPTETAAAESRATDVPGDRFAKTVVVRDGPHVILAVVRAGDRVDLEKLRAVLGIDRHLVLAAEHDVSERFSMFAPGAIPPLGMPLVAATVVDARLLLHPEVVCAGGDHTHAIRLAAKDVVRLAGADVADIAHDWASGVPRTRS